MGSGDILLTTLFGLEVDLFKSGKGSKQRVRPVGADVINWSIIRIRRKSSLISFTRFFLHPKRQVYCSQRKRRKLVAGPNPPITVYPINFT